MATTNSIADSQLYEVPPVTLPDELLRTILLANVAQLDYIHTFLRLAMLHVSRQRNTFAVAACLPPEVLLLIFEHVVGVKDSTILRVLSQVCGRWRAIVLEDPLLWRKALNFTGGHKWVGEVVMRTKKVPLWIGINQYDFTEDYGENIIPNVNLVTGKHFSRCAIFDIEGHSGEIEEILESVNTNYGAPLLRSLSIRNISCSVQEHVVNVPDRLLKTSMPRLTSLRLERCAFSWDAIHTGIASHSHSLKSLCISNVCDTTPATTLSELSLILEFFPLLEDLRLQDAISTMAGDNGTTEVALQRLSSLHIWSSIDTCTAFLAIVCAPSLVDLAVDVNATPEPSPGGVHELMTSIQLVVPSHLVCTSLDIAHNSGCLIIWLGHGRAPKPFVEVTLRDWAPRLLGDRFPDVITSMVVIQPLRSVQEFYVSLPYSVERQVAAETWRHFFSHINRVSHIHLGNRPPALLLRALYLDAHMAHLQRSDEPHLLLPSLAKISLTPIYEYRVFVDMIVDLRASAAGLLTTRTLLQQCADEGFADLDAIHNQIVAWATNAGDTAVPDWVTRVVEDESSIGDFED
ncbi:hypothetical protein EDD15DRAFT_2375569 [Pisolithus albus]|nr:hypothetical protein EDD15DRAFT_2375569 [Pisolithus albus]